MKKALIGLVLVFASALAWAVPSEQDVRNAIGQGQYTQAQSMMAEVVGAQPNSAKAHYIYAEVLAHNGVFNKATEEAAKAQQIDPKIGFTDPAKFNEFQQLLQREQGAQKQAPRAAPSSYSAPAPVPSSSSGGGIPAWMWLVGLVVIGIVLARGLLRSRAAPGGGGVPPGYGQAAGMQGGYGPGGYGSYGPGGVPVQPGRSGLGTAAAVAGGVAGGVLLDEFLHRGDNHGGGGVLGNAFGADPAATELENRGVDFGNGNDWGSGGGGGGGVDFGGGGGDSGGGGGGDWT